LAAPQNRMVLYMDERVNRLLTQMLERGVRSLEPTVNNDGSVEYEMLDRIVEPGRAQPLLDGLTEAGIFEREVAQQILICPDHGNSTFSAHLTCRKCGSPRLRRRVVLEHPLCGAVAEDTKFLKEERMVCPKCGRQLAPAHLKPKGGWYECEACETKQEQPHLKLTCLKGRHTLGVAQAVGIDIYRYVLTPQAEQEFKGSFLLNALLADMLGREGYRVQLGAQVTGRSGVVHTVDLLVQTANGGKIVVKTHVSDQPLDEKGVLTAFLLNYDIQPDLMIMAVMPGANEGAEKLAPQYGIRLVCGSVAGEVARRFREEVLPKIEALNRTR